MWISDVFLKSVTGFLRGSAGLRIKHGSSSLIDGSAFTGSLGVPKTTICRSLLPSCSGLLKKLLLRIYAQPHCKLSGPPSSILISCCIKRPPCFATITQALPTLQLKQEHKPQEYHSTERNPKPYMPYPVLYGRSPKVGNPIASILKSNV